MSSDEGQVNLSEICEDVSYGYTESATNDPVGPKFLRITDIQGGSFDWSKVPYCPASDENIKKYRLEIGDILIARTGNSTGENAQVITEPPAAVFASYLIRFRPDSSRVNPFFVGYQLRSEKFRQHVLAVRGGSAQPGANAKQLGAFPVQLIARERQDAAVEILRSLDDRISLMRETNVTLEAIAQALFKSWFVDFDPVRAKMEGRVPEGMDEATAALFPDSFEESELGLVPRGWRVGVLGDVLALRNERIKPSEVTQALPYVPIESISAKVPFLQEYKSGEEANSSLILFRKGDILFGAMRPYFHKVCAAPFNGVTRTTVFTLQAKNPMAFGYALFLVFQEATIEYATLHSEGSTIPYAKWGKSLEYMPVILPPDSIQIGYGEIVSSFIERANENIKQVQTLANLRDTLLPRLISGQLRLSEVQSA